MGGAEGSVCQEERGSWGHQTFCSTACNPQGPLGNSPHLWVTLSLVLFGGVFILCQTMSSFSYSTVSREKILETLQGAGEVI